MRFMLLAIKLLGRTYDLKAVGIGRVNFFIYTLLIAVVINPIMEELLFRVCMIEIYRTLLGKVYGIIVSALLFGFAHSSVQHQISAMCIGIILGIIYILSENVVACILVHAVVVKHFCNTTP